MRVDSLSSNLPTALIRPQKATRGRAKDGVPRSWSPPPPSKDIIDAYSLHLLVFFYPMRVAFSIP